MNSATRPLPLRVPVIDVTVRSSLVNSERRRGHQHPGLIVVQRPVRIISDAPPAPERDDSVMASHLRAAAEDHYVVEDPLELEEEDELGSAHAASEASASAIADEEGDDEEDEAEVLEVSLPPPAPPEALRRTPSSPSNPVVQLDVTSTFRPVSAEIDLDFEARASAPQAEPVRVPTPPTMAAVEPPDLGALALARAARVQDLRPTKPRTHAWWEVFFDDDYLRTVRAPTREQIARQCDFVERRLGLKPGASVLDVGCGLGLHVLEMTERGYASVGLDLSLAMLSRASEEAQARNLRINFRHGDMRELSFDSSFDAVTCLGTSFGYFDDETNRRVIERLCRALKPGGVLLLDVVNRDHVIRAQPNLIWFEGEGCVCMEESDFNYFTSRLQVKRTVILDMGKQIESEYSLRLYSLHEIGQLMNSVGFRVAEVSGREALPGVFFGQESPNLMIVAERRPPPEAAPAPTAPTAPVPAPSTE